MDTSQQQEPSGAEDANGSDDEKDLSPEEKRVLERKMKKILKKEEKKRLKEEGKSIKKVKVQSNLAEKKALEYLAWWDKHSYFYAYICFPGLPEIVKQCFNGFTSCLCACLAGLRDGRSGSFTKAGKYGYCSTCMTPQRYKKLPDHHWSLQLYTLITVIKLGLFYWFWVLNHAYGFFFVPKKVLFFIISFNCFHCMCMHFSLYFRWLTIISKCC